MRAAGRLRPPPSSSVPSCHSSNPPPQTYNAAAHLYATMYMVHLVRADLTKIRHISNQQMPNCATSMNQSLLVHSATGRETLARHLTKHCNGKSHKTSDCTGKEVEPVSKGFKLKIEKVKGKQTSICSTSQTKLCHCVPARGVTSKSIQTVTNS